MKNIKRVLCFLLLAGGLLTLTQGCAFRFEVEPRQSVGGSQ